MPLEDAGYCAVTALSSASAGRSALPARWACMAGGWCASSCRPTPSPKGWSRRSLLWTQSGKFQLQIDALQPLGFLGQVGGSQRVVVQPCIGKADADVVIAYLHAQPWQTLVVADAVQQDGQPQDHAQAQQGGGIAAEFVKACSRNVA